MDKIVSLWVFNEIAGEVQLQCKNPLIFVSTSICRSIFLISSVLLSSLLPHYLITLHSTRSCCLFSPRGGAKKKNDKVCRQYWKVEKNWTELNYTPTHNAMRRWRRLETNGKFIAAIIISFAVFKSFISSSAKNRRPASKAGQNSERKCGKRRRRRRGNLLN